MMKHKMIGDYSNEHFALFKWKIIDRADYTSVSSSGRGTLNQMTQALLRFLKDNNLWRRNSYWDHL